MIFSSRYCFIRNGYTFIKYLAASTIFVYFWKAVITARKMCLAWSLGFKNSKLYRGVGILPENWVGVCSPLHKTLTLFMNIICDFNCLLSYYFMTIATGTVALIIIYDGLFLMVLSDNDDN